MKLKLRLELPDVKIYLVLLLMIGENRHSLSVANKAIKAGFMFIFCSDSGAEWRRRASILLG